MDDANLRRGTGSSPYLSLKGVNRDLRKVPSARGEYSARDIFPGRTPWISGPRASQKLSERLSVIWGRRLDHLRPSQGLKKLKIWKMAFFGMSKILNVVHFLFFSRFFFKQQVPKTYSCVFFFFPLAFEKFKSSFLFFFWAEAETRKSVYLKSGLGRAFWSKIGRQNSTHVFLFFFVRGWLENRTHMLGGD